MSEDARNSIYLWAGTLALFCLFWVTWHFHLLEGLSDAWFVALGGLSVLINVARTAWAFWKRRTSSTESPGG